ncbi:ATP-binding protein [Archaeoglobales archaeon]|nr:MAG: ATP-binding protein [Archaeoglobales archaeon]
MKILVCGKGGCGKSVVAALIAKELANRGKRVLVVDTDESNFGIYRNFGVEQPKDFMEYLGGKDAVREVLIKSIQNGSGERVRMFKKITIDEIPEDYVVSKGNIKIMAIGKIHDFGEGCACPMGAVAREFLEALKLNEDEYVVVDTDAGIEHFGRGVEAGCDVIVAIVEPSYESIQLTNKIVELANKIGKRVVILANKVDDETAKLIKADAYLPFKREIYIACLEGKELPEVDEIGDVVDILVAN